jgi:HEPN domain-containing protein
MDTQKMIAYWLDNAQDATETIDRLIQGNKYHHALFFAHLSLESLIKAYVIQQTQTHPPYTHDLTKLLLHVGEPLAPHQQDELDEITTFCVEARYPEIKKKLYDKATPEYTTKWLSIIEGYRQWIHTKLTRQ